MNLRWEKFAALFLFLCLYTTVPFKFVASHQCNVDQIPIDRLKMEIEERHNETETTLEIPQLDTIITTFLNKTQEAIHWNETQEAISPSETTHSIVQQATTTTDKPINEIIQPNFSAAIFNATTVNVPPLITITSVEVAEVNSNLTERELKLINMLRPLVEHSLVHGYQKVDSYLLRWLNARNFDVDAAAKFLLEAQEWRRAHNVDTILNETIFTFSPKPYSLAGIDRAGDPFVAFTPTNLDLRRIVVSGNGGKVGRYWIQIMEEASFNAWRVSNLTGRDTSRGGCLLDLSGFNIVQHGCLQCIPIFLEWAISYENLYPDFATYIIWINVPRIFLPVFELVKPFMSPTTRKVLQVFGPDKKEWSTRLHTLISLDQLSVRFGGTRKS